MKVIKDEYFDCIGKDEKSCVYEIFPNVFCDERGSFSEVVKTQSGWNRESEYPLWMSNTTWIKQINRSVSTYGVVRGCHAQRGSFCQGKMVESVNGIIFDIITDARPNSRSFGKSKAYTLDFNTQNKVWVPRGFLHSFVTSDDETVDRYIFSYYVDNSYCKESEIVVNPMTVLPNVSEVFEPLRRIIENSNGKLTLSEKDLNGTSFEEFCENVVKEYEKTGKNWYE